MTDELDNIQHVETEEINISDSYIVEETTTVQKNEEPIITQKPLTQPVYYTVFANFPNSAIQIEYINQTTNETDKILATSGELKMIQGRIYKVPINDKNIDSDNFANYKIFGEMATLIEVLYIKDGIAYIIPRRHNAIIKHSQRLCVVW